MNDPHDLLDPALLNDPAFRESVLYEYEMLHQLPPKPPRVRRAQVTGDDLQIILPPPDTGQDQRVIDSLPSPAPQKKPQSGTTILVSAFIIGMIVLIVGGNLVGRGAVTGTAPSSSQRPVPTLACPGYSVLCKPTVSAHFIDQVLQYYSSPAAGDGQSLYDLGVKYGIDPVYALAFFMNESTFGRAGEARATLSLGNERCIPDRPCIDQDRGGYAKMNSWQDGFEQWFKLIKNLYVTGAINQVIRRKACPCTTIPQIIPVYAPNSDGNNELHYIQAVEHAVDTWRSGKIAV